MARALYGLTAIAAIAGIILQGSITVRQLGLMPGLWSLAAYFTEWTNALVVLVAGASALAPTSWLAKSRFRIMMLVAISIVGMVYSLALRAVMPDDLGMLLAGSIQHDVVPLLFILAWIVGPHGRTDGRLLGWIIAWPLTFLAAMLLRGILTDWYPYWFIDPAIVGPVDAVLGGASVLIAFVVLGILALWAERALARRSAF